MNVRKFLEATPESLAAEQRKILTSEAVQRLKNMADHLDKGNYDAATKMLSLSPAGDDMGGENWFIDFGDLLPMGEDIGDVINKLNRLKQQENKA